MIASALLRSQRTGPLTIDLIRLDTRPLHGPRSCLQLDKDIQGTVAIEKKCGPTGLITFRKVWDMWGSCCRARNQLAQALLGNNPYPLPDAFLALFLLSCKHTILRERSWEKLLFYNAQSLWPQVLPRTCHVDSELLDSAGVETSICSHLNLLISPFLSTTESW